MKTEVIPRRKRDSNMELLRVISMMLVMVLHADYASIGSPEPNDFHAAFFSSGLRVFIQQLAVVCVNIFVLISGWFSIKPSARGAGRLLFQVLFLEVLILLVALIKKEPVTGEHLVKLFVIGSSYWFVPAYLLLYCIAPALNSFVDSSSPKEIRLFLISFFFIEFTYGFLFADMIRFGYGYSAISFIGLYVLGRYVRLYPPKVCQLSLSYDFLIILGLTVLSTFFATVFIQLGNNKLAPQATFINPLVIIASVYWLIAFSKMKFQSKVINWMGKSCFAIYLIHCHPLVFPVYTD